MRKKIAFACGGLISAVAVSGAAIIAPPPATDGVLSPESASATSDANIFAGCGELFQGVECVLFQSDEGGAYLLENLGGFGVGDRVLVAGILDPDCFTICLEGDGCIFENAILSCSDDGMVTICHIPPGNPANAREIRVSIKALPAHLAHGDTIGPCEPAPFEGCGEIVQGVECVLFQADAGGLYLLDDLGGFGVGDRVFVTGIPDPDCFTICLEGDGCIFGNTIEACVEPFEGCGELVQGVECVLFQADAGGLYLLENLAGFGVGDRVFVTGIPDPDCFTICLEGDGCIFGNTIEACVEPFEGCGELVQGVECVLFQADAGGLYLLENLAGFGVGDRVFVTGIPDPDCFTICLEGDGCIFGNTIEACVEPFEGCGELVQGVECVLFQADAGGLYLLENLDGFGVGDRVSVAGILDPGCFTICLEGDGCIFGNTIEACVEPFEGCGELVQGVECVLFQADAGGLYLLENLAGFGVGDRVLVTGIPDPDCFTICLEGDGCIFGNTIEACVEPFEGCGELVQGVECVLFQADAGGLYLLENLAGFGVGDRVSVAGILDPGCFTICLEGDGCIFGNTIEACVEPFEGCGELVQGVECVLFQADAGGLYLLENLDGFGVGDRVFVTGTLDPGCFTICLEGDGCIFGNTIEACVFEGCGELVQGVECVLFQADAGGLYLLENLDGFGVGDRVSVAGILDPGCFTICLEGDGCIFGNTIEACVEPFEGCGTLVQGVECVLFQADAGGLYLLDDLGGFGVGDELFVTGTLDPGCFTICLEGDGCIFGTTTGTCP